MTSLTIKDLDLNCYKNCNEQFIYGVKGIVRLPLGMEIIYGIARSYTYMPIETLYNSKIQCIFAVTDKRIIFIPINSKYPPISFNYDDIDISYHDQILDKIFLLDIKNKKLLNFSENKLVFRIYSGQNLQVNKINCILKEYKF